ncbi:tRNA-dihydrouridine synthase family protein [Pelagicoccus sp. SDUM812003]|uniref:tRNA dihydrouridine synthase n=1 Tax=Pelagicoccus sp. SDUM812003 TaxID=3041267 RepID=UPI00280DDF84|nr:tRNA-dihydrouridine synthase family protein [Pelagicoccus sp. SDUM812003]MDQ8202890.1 tRNA-dihydrouridine synthase family protein [Pelagicoccus sp. SDUM812003]
MSSEIRNAQRTRLPAPIVEGQPITALAPMQDVTDRPFMRVISAFGAPDYYVTEYFRVHAQSRLEKHILEAITQNDTDRPVFAQMIGEDTRHLLRSAKELLNYPVAGIDLNMGCPSPTVYKKQCGGGLLRDVAKVDAILGALRQAIPGLFTVKMRIGFQDTENFAPLLELINKHQVDMLSLHGRTVKEMYRSEVHYDYIKQAVESVSCPVLANGDITSARKARWALDFTGAEGVMVGRHAIRNPWIFKQIREEQAGLPVSRIPLYEVNRYVHMLYSEVSKPHLPERGKVNKMKKYLNFVGQGVDPDGAFLYEMRRAKTEDQLFEICDRHMPDEPGRFFADEPFEGVVARPNCES